MKKYLLVFSFLLFSFTALKASATEIHLYCTGTIRGENWDDDLEKFDLLVNTDTGDMSGYPLGITMGCSPMFGITKEEQKCSIDNLYVTCSCESSLFLVETFGMTFTPPSPAILP